MKRTLGIILVVVLMAMSFSAYAAEYAYVKTPTSDGSVYVRRVAGAGQPIVGYAKNGDKLEILKRGNTWHKVRVVRTGVEGYMYGVYIDFSSGYTSGSSSGWNDVGNTNVPAWGSGSASYVPDASVTDKDSVLNQSGTISSSDGYANLRWGAGTNFGVINRVYNGNVIWVLERNGEWYRAVTSAGQIGYIHKSLVKVSSSTSSMAYGKTGEIRSSDGFANVRTGAGTNHSVLYKLYVGDKTGVYGSSGQWFEVNRNGGWQSAYVHRTLVRFAHAARTTGNVYLRTGPNKTYSSIRVLANGTEVTLLATDGNFCRVDTGREIGYMSRKYIAF